MSGDDGDFDLDGGSIIGRPIQNETPRKEGVVRVKILVDKYGKVTSATYDGAGSNTADSELIEMACRAAHHHMDENLARLRSGLLPFDSNRARTPRPPRGCFSSSPCSSGKAPPPTKPT